MAVSTLQMPTVVEESSIREQHSPVSTNTANILSHPTKRRRTLHRRRRQHHLQQQQSKIHHTEAEDEEEEEEDDELLEADIEEEEDEVEYDDEDAVREVNNTTIAATNINGIEASGEAKQQEQLYSLRWHDFQTSILSSFRHLRDVEDFVDVTLACDGKSFTAHKMVLSACSPYFRQLLKVKFIINNTNCTDIYKFKTIGNKVTQLIKT